MYDYQSYIQRNYPNMMGVDPMTYPKIYYVVLPVVQKKCMEMDAMCHPMMRPYPCYENIEKMSDEVCEECFMNEPEMLKEYQIRAENETAQFFGPNRLFRDLVGILLIRELLRRRNYPYPYYPPVYGPGFGGFGRY